MTMYPHYFMLNIVGLITLVFGILLAIYMYQAHNMYQKHKVEYDKIEKQIGEDVNDICHKYPIIQGFYIRPKILPGTWGEMAVYLQSTFFVFLCMACMLFLSFVKSSSDEHWWRYIYKTRLEIDEFLDGDDGASAKFIKKMQTWSEERAQVNLQLLWETIDTRIKQRKFGDGPFEDSEEFIKWSAKLRPMNIKIDSQEEINLFKEFIKRFFKKKN